MNRQVVSPDPAAPLRGARIVYPKSSTSKGEAWAHLWANMPSIVSNGRNYVPYFEPMGGTFKDGTERRRNPYRKDHDDFAWAWVVTSWVPGTPKKRAPKAPKPEPRSRYELLTDDAWLDGGVEDLE